MIDLPGALAPWANELSVLSTDLALTMAPWIGRLAMAVGPLSDIRTQRSYEPDGYAGLARRGSYERLVTAEWALAELFPDEFLRRAASGEHLFFDLLRRGPRGALRSVVVVSAGPAQIGAPRLVHLAALIVFARRAAAAGATFSWGILEAPERGLYDGFDANAVRRLLTARTTITAGEPAVQAWRNALGPRPGVPGDDTATDWWLIGAPALTPWARRAGAGGISVCDVIAPGVRAMDVAVHRRSAEVPLRLELPPPNDCGRLLRDPLAAGRGSRVGTSSGAVRRIHFGGPVRRLLVELTNGNVQSWPLPTSPAESLGAPRSFTVPYGERLVGLGAYRRSVLALTVVHDDASSVRAYFGDTQRAAHIALPDAVARRLAELVRREDAPAPGPCTMRRVRAGRPHELVCLLAGAALVVPELQFPLGSVTTATAIGLGDDDIDSSSVGGMALSDGAIWSSAKPGGALIVRCADEKGPRIGAYSFWSDKTPHDGEPAVVFGFSTAYPAVWGLVAARVNGRDWRVDGAGLHHERVVCPTRVFGVACFDRKPALLTLLDEQRLGWQFRDSVQALPPASAPITAAIVCANRPQIAWVTSTGEVVVYSCQHNAVVMKLTEDDRNKKRLR